MKTVGWLIIFSAIGGAMAFIIEWGTQSSAFADAQSRREAEERARRG